MKVYILFEIELYFTKTVPVIMLETPTFKLQEMN